jgi:hypothetical protein
MANIFARSPFIVEINETNQIETKIELFIWNGYTAAPASPTYTISKLIPSTSNRQTLYNISPYIKEFFTHAIFQNLYNAYTTGLNTSEWCNVNIKLYKKTSTTFSQVGSTLSYKAFDGYSLYTQGVNEDLGDYLLDEDTYLYWYDSSANLATQRNKRAGCVSFIGNNTDKVKYTNLVSGTSITQTLTQSLVYTVPRVHHTYMASGNKLEILNASDTVLWTGTFKPQVECKYTPVVIDFINKYGAWQREFFFKASKSTINTTNSTYNLLQNNIYGYNVLEGQRKTFNHVMLESITVNSDWRNDSYAEVIRQLSMSDRILLNERPVILKTQSIELQKQINTKMINYSLEFEYSSDINNTVV